MPKLICEESNVTEDAIKAHVKKIISEEVIRFAVSLMEIVLGSREKSGRTTYFLE